MGFASRVALLMQGRPRPEGEGCALSQDECHLDLDAIVRAPAGSSNERSPPGSRPKGWGVSSIDALAITGMCCGSLSDFRELDDIWFGELHQTLPKTYSSISVQCFAEEFWNLQRRPVKTGPAS